MLEERLVPGRRDGVALEDDVEGRYEIHDGEQGYDDVLGVDVASPRLGDADEHQRDAELDGDDGEAVEHLEEKEPLEGGKGGW